LTIRDKIYANRRNGTHILACNSVKRALLALPRLVLGRFINVVSRCFFEFEASCMNNLAAGSTDVNQAPRSTGPHDYCWVHDQPWETSVAHLL